MELSQARGYFPVSERLIYWNHAAVSPLATPTRQAMEEVTADYNLFGALHWQEWIAAQARVRATLARLVGAAPTEVAFTKNTSDGLNIVAQGLDWQRGDRVVSFACEFPANLYPWLALRARGVVVELLPEAALLDLNRIRAACRGARLLTVSWVQYLSGARVDLAALGQICRESGTLLMVDAIQGLGAFPMDVKRCGIHFLAADGHKWMTGPDGAGFLFVDEGALDQVTPPQAGWLSVADWEDYAAAQRAAADASGWRWREGASRFECGTLNTVGLIGLGAAVELLLSVGVSAIADHILGLGDVFAAGLRRQGCEILRASEQTAHRSGITSFRHPQRDSTALVADWEAVGIICAQRNGWVRCAPHLYNTEAEAERLLSLLAEPQP